MSCERAPGRVSLTICATMAAPWSFDDKYHCGATALGPIERHSRNAGSLAGDVNGDITTQAGKAKPLPEGFWEPFLRRIHERLFARLLDIATSVTSDVHFWYNVAN
jgi:hypothetical protein